ncbi:hypothetical protein [Pedobacter sp. Leaf194]|uniref:DUF7946 domain-containing protein n=1 Tax=Pedobacter sp. Leaf194 TaxID=1736297 RepID=UPI00070352DD|nr:hypothetical protein [Pedobacter sp. Leaf194]KQS41758.1 hypothetical protein ASG14_04725 [Pedobacter sp. Leaf194]
MPQEIKFIIRYTGGTADDRRLDLYDASRSMAGLAKALSITVHALLNDGEVKRKGDSTHGVNFLLHPSRQGSFIEFVSIIFEDDVIKGIGASILSAAFWDFIKYTWREATGREGELEEPSTRRIVNRNPSYEDEISRSLENPLQELHRPIANDNDIKIEITRPRVGVVVEFNRATLDYVMSEEDPVIESDVFGNVTKYNNLSGIGRFYDNVREKTVSFHSSQLDDEQKRTLTWSLHNSNGNNAAGKILIDVQVIKTHAGHIKRYTITDARRQNQN